MPENYIKETYATISPLEEGVSLQLSDNKNGILFKSSGKWLYPLFEVEDYLSAMKLNAAELFLHDKIAGCAAASLISRMGFRRCYIDTISRPAYNVFERFNLDFGYNILVDKIACMTEELITEDMDIEEVYLMLSRRAGRVQDHKEL